MAFKKGHSGNPAGRQKGVPNKTTKELRNILNEIIESNFSKAKVSKDLKQLSPKNRLEVMLRMMDFVLPKLKTKESEQKNYASAYEELRAKLKANQLNNSQD